MTYGITTQLQRIPIRAASIPVLSIKTSNRAIISVPTQIGCPVGCTFCVSSQSKFQRNLTADEIVKLVTANVGSHPITLAFTGEGDVTLNMSAVTEAVDRLKAMNLAIERLRFSVSGIAAHKLSQIPHNQFPTELQFSLHSAVNDKRLSLVPNSVPLDVVERELRMVARRFTVIRLNYVLMSGVNDSEADIEALGAWGDEDWVILLNPLLTESGAVHHPATEQIAKRLRQAGRRVEVFKTVGKELCETNIYPSLTYKLLD
jgi:23S rRNA (adenine2503-C2)-methyltransferase